MQCPFGEEVGDPATIVRCTRGFPGCACADEAIIAQSPEADQQTVTVLEWWREQGFIFVDE